VNPKLEATLAETVEALKKGLGPNLYACCLYGSAVRGNAIDGISDINLLIVLEESDVAAHQAVAKALEGRPQVDPFVLARRGFERSAKAFAPKFASIRRHHRVLCGADPVADLKVDPVLERFLCEQALRNLRLRLVYSFVTQPQLKSYGRFVQRNITAIFVQFSEVLRLQGVAIPVDFAARIPIFEKEFGVDGVALRELLELKREPKRFSDTQVNECHQRLFPVVEAVLRWIESHWNA
jgi:predicted nucleotidyltransferase